MRGHFPFTYKCVNTKRKSQDFEKNGGFDKKIWGQLCVPTQISFILEMRVNMAITKKQFSKGEFLSFAFKVERTLSFALL